MNKPRKQLRFSDSDNGSIENLIQDSFFTELRKNPMIGINSSTYLSGQLDRMITEFKTNIYYAPYTVICQSSGFGKSRACAALVDQGFFVVYCCLRKKGVRGFPKRSCLADDLLSTKPDISRYFKCYFSTFIEIANAAEQDCRDFFEKYQQENDSEYNLAKNLVDAKFRSLSNKVTIPHYTQERKLIFVFDEASSLLDVKSNGRSNFFLIRSILSDLKPNIFVLFLDTFSHLSEFMPPILQDPSNRVFSDRLKVFEPIYLLPNWDLFVTSDSVKSIQDSVIFENMCLFGRALWGSWMHTRTNSNGKYESIDHRDLYHLAASKLISKSFEDEFDEKDWLAILSCRIGIIRPKCLSTCKQLVAKHMAVCTYVDNEREIFEIDYPSEPILAEAAAFLINRKQNWQYFIDKLIYLTETCLISTGDKGEIIAKLILIMSMDRINGTIKPNYPLQFSRLIYVGEFIQSIYGKCRDKCANVDNNWSCDCKDYHCCIKIIKKHIDSPHRILNGYINFSHFTRPKDYMNKTSLVTALKRCAAFHCKSGQKAIDLVIPVACNRQNFSSISAILVQVKLWDCPAEPEYSSVMENIDSSLFCDMSKDIPYLFLYMQLGAPIANKSPYLKCIQRPTSSQPNQNVVIYSQGISSKLFHSLDSNIESKLIAFAASNQKLFKLKNDKTSAKIYDLIRFI